MRAAVYTELSGPGGIEIRELEKPKPSSGSAVVRTVAAGINSHDLRMLSNGSSWVTKSDLPYVSGADLAGVVEEVGTNVESVEPGDRVVLCPLQTCGRCRFCRDGPENNCAEQGLFHGAFAERVSVEADRLIRLPDAVSFVEAAALPVSYMTAWHMVRRIGITAGDLVLVPGATGGVGVAAIQLLCVTGSRSIGTTTSSEKVRQLENIGATHALQVTSPEELREKVRQIGEPKGAINHLGGAYIQAGLSTLQQRGKMAVCGRTTGEHAEINIKDHFRKQRTLIGSAIGTQPDLERIIGFVEEDQIVPVVNKVFALEEINTAFAQLEEREQFGKIVLEL